MKEGTVTLGAARVSAADVVAVAGGARVAIDTDATALLARSHAVVEAALAEGRPVYGLNTMLGAGRDTRVSPEAIAAFQRQVIANHLGGIGPALPEPEVRALVFARLAGLSRGGSGVRPRLVEAYASLLNAGAYPVVPARGSVGAGDLTHLAAVAAVLIGTGEAFLDGTVVSGAEALAAAGLQPVELAAGEALAAMSSNAYSIGVGALAVSRLGALAAAADGAVALSLEAVGRQGTGGNLSPFDAAIQQATGRTGQTDAAASVRALLTGSLLADPSRAVTVQDPLSFRTVPQLHGTLRDRVTVARAEVETELNARSENPLVDAESGSIRSGGNFQVLSLALSFETLRVALAHVASASERRIAALSDLSSPMRSSGISRIPGLLWYSASGILAELRHLAAPATLAGASLSGVEDQASHAPLALQLLQRSTDLTLEVLAIEALHAAQLLDPGPDAVLGEGPARLVPALHGLFDARLPASALVTESVGVLLRG